LAVEGFGLTVGKWLSGCAEGLLFGAVRGVAVLDEELQAFLDVPNGINDGLNGTVLVVPSWRDLECELADACEFFEELFGIEQPMIIGKMLEAGVHVGESELVSVEGANLYKLYRV